MLNVVYGPFLTTKTPFLLCSYFHAHPTTLLLKILGDQCMGRPPISNFCGDRPPVPPRSPPLHWVFFCSYVQQYFPVYLLVIVWWRGNAYGWRWRCAEGSGDAIDESLSTGTKGRRHRSSWQPGELCYVMLHVCYTMLCYVVLCYVMLCYVMLCYVMLCYVIWLFV